MARIYRNVKDLRYPETKAQARARRAAQGPAAREYQCGLMLAGEPEAQEENLRGGGSRLDRQGHLRGVLGAPGTERILRSWAGRLRPDQDGRALLRKQQMRGLGGKANLCSGELPPL
eukprot:4543894-Alexandrium_andersonii.AAC.1